MLVASSLSHARDKTKNIFRYFFTKLKTFYLSYSIYKHDAIDIADPSSMQDACYMTSLTVESLWLSGRASEVWGSIPCGDSEFFLCPKLVTRRKHLSLFLYRAQNLPSLLFYLQ